MVSETKFQEEALCQMVTPRTPKALPGSKKNKQLVVPFYYTKLVYMFLELILYMLQNFKHIVHKDMQK